MKVHRLRSSPTRASITDPQAQVDKGAGMLRGVSAVQAVEALGHGMVADAKTLTQCCDAINAAPGGARVRFTHPGMCSDSLGKMLGRASNARVEGDKVACDIQMAKFAEVSPDGDLANYVMARAAEDPASFGMSIAFSGMPAWLLDDGSEVDEEMEDGTQRERPSNAVGDLPRARISKLHAVDVVDEPAANRDGLFSAKLSLSEEAFHTIDAFAAENGLSQERLSEFVCRYFAARGLVLSVTKPAVKPAHNPQKGNAMKPEELKALKAKHPDHAGLIVDMFGDGKGEVEILAAIKDAKLAAVESANKELAAKVEKATADTAAALTAKDDQIKKLSEDLAKANKIAELGTGAPAPIGGVAVDGEELTADDSALSKHWASDKALRDNFLGDKDAFIALSKLDAEQLLAVSGRGRSVIRGPVAANVAKSTPSTEEAK